ncbi:MAG: hypothetical protein E6Q73_08715 [Pseudorhodobacter sp.]|nr:MAG: hypothetical protein E6Q73_08715 [Pseudorhodobacter sp.]
MFRKIFLDHPREVDEGFFEHFRVAAGFGLTMIIGGMGALVHAFIPALCVTSGSDTIRRLHTLMVEKRGAKRDATVEMLSAEWVI